MMTYGKLPASQIKPGDWVMPPRNFGKHKEVCLVTSAGRAVVLTFADASQMSADKRDKLCVGVAAHWPPLNGGIQ